MIYECEVIRQGQHASDADALLYTPMKAGLTMKHSRTYRFDFEGDEAALRAFARAVLVDEVSQEISDGTDPVVKDALFHLDYSMKPGALDLEKEAIMNYYRSRNGDTFVLKQLHISQRVYIFGEGDAVALSTRFIKDIVNPAVHKHQLSIAG
ncbi:MAG: hypothetical protein RLZZ553_174 [Verrucomicrobiota bacterium]|jgi:hypothetical protein